ncbi:MAG: peptidoglycan-binding protein [Candidatus Taylorbacteria bacterium]|nr:peptidoglycan-binding protein [Candidatus Taylorbacteria bacterium]
MTKITQSVGLSAGSFFRALFLALIFIAAPAAHADTNILAGNDLTVGATGQGVVVLQGLLSEMGYLNIPSSVPMGYFGSLTKSALARYQTSESVSPAVGYFGPVTKIRMHQQFASHNWLTMMGW